MYQMIWCVFFRLKYTMHKSEPVSERWRERKRLDLNANFHKPFSLCTPLFVQFKNGYASCTVSGPRLACSKIWSWDFYSIGVCRSACSPFNFYRDRRIKQTFVWYLLTRSVNFKMHFALFILILLWHWSNLQYIEIVQSFRGEMWREANGNIKRQHTLTKIYRFDSSTVRCNTFRYLMHVTQ